MHLSQLYPLFSIKSPSPTYAMSDFPKYHVNINRPFRISGADYGSPIFIKEGGVRSKRKSKDYTDAANELNQLYKFFINKTDQFISRRNIKWKNQLALHSAEFTRFWRYMRGSSKVGKTLLKWTIRNVSKTYEELYTCSYR